MLYIFMAAIDLGMNAFASLDTDNRMAPQLTRRIIIPGLREEQIPDLVEGMRLSRQERI